MGLFDWLFRRKPRGESGTPAGQPTPGKPSATCHHCGTRLRQSRDDGRCVACGKYLSEAPSAPQTAPPPQAAPRPAPAASPRTKPPRPTNVQQIGNSPMLAFEQGDIMMLMDRDAFDYTYGDADGPDPAQRDLDALLPRVTRVCVLEGAMFQGRAMGGPVLVDTREETAIRELADCLRIVEDANTFSHCACLGGPTMELYAGAEHLATIGIQHGNAIRWKQWYHDAQLQSGEQLNRWLHAQGVAPARLEAIYKRGNNHLIADAEKEDEASQLCAQANVQAQQGRFAEAIDHCTRALAQNPELAEAYALRAQLYYQTGRLPEAAVDCSAAIERGYRNSGVYFIRAVARDGAGQTEEALADCEMALHLDPQNAGAYNSRGFIRVRLGRLDEAVADFSEAIRLVPKWFLPVLHRAKIAHNRGQLDAALTDYDRAVELIAEVPPAGPLDQRDPTPALVYCHRGDARFDRFHEEEAEADFAEARRRHPAAAANYLGEMWLRRMNWDRAQQAYTEFIELRPQDARGYLGRGMARQELGDPDQAIADFSEAIRLQTDSPGGYAVRAAALARQGRLDDALADLAELLRITPHDAMAYLFRASLHTQRAASADALSDLNAAHRLAPDNPHVCNNLAWLLATCADAQLRDGPRAVALARQACEATEWKQPYCLGTLAAALAETGQFAEAIRWQSEALPQYPEQEKAAGQARLELYQVGQPYRAP